MKIKPIYIILALAFFLRIVKFDYPLLSDEPNRDYLVTRHILKYGEFIHYGPNNGTLPSLGNSPIYNYILALPLLIFDDLMFLTAINLILQVVLIYLIYLMTRKLINERVGIIASTLLAFGQIFIFQSEQIWQPNLMMFFLTLSSYLIFLSFEKKRYGYVIYASVVFAAAISIHMSALGLLPSFIWSIFLIRNRLKITNIKVLGVILTFLLSLIIFYLPIFKNLGNLELNSRVSFQNIIASLFQRLNTVFESLKTPVFIGIFILFIGMIKRYYFLTLSMVTFLSTTLALDSNFLPQHFYPVYILFVVLFAQLIGEIKSKILIGGIIMVFIYTNTVGLLKNTNLFKFDKLEAKNLIIDTLSTEIENIKEEREFENVNFFQFKIYDSPEVTFFTNNPQTSDAFLWTHLEKQFQEKLVTLTNSNNEVGYTRNNQSDVIFIFCRFYDGYQKEQEHCISKFVSENKGYEVEEEAILNTYNQSVYKSFKI